MPKSYNKYEDADELFKKHTIKEVADIQKKIKNDIERKKEDLRQLVGEKYHNLIEAADTIREMRTSIEQVTRHIHLLESTSGSFVIGNSKYAPSLKQSDDVPKHSHSLAAEIKILADAPSKLWFFLDNKDLLSAGKLYLLAQHTQAMLTLNEGSTLNQHFPFVEQQWTGISRFFQVILQNCRNVIKLVSTPFEKIAEALCCIMLLEGLTVNDVFVELLESRFSAIRAIFDSLQPSVSVKVQVCELVTLIQNTICAVNSVIVEGGMLIDKESAGQNQCHLLAIIDKVVQNESDKPVELAKSFSQHVYHHLPQSIANFRCKFKTTPCPIPAQELQATCQEWMDSVNKSVQHELNELLKYVNTVKGMSQVHNTVIQLQEENWDVVCNHVLGKPFSVWDAVLRRAFVNRVEAIVEQSLLNTFKTTKDAITQCLNDFNDNLLGAESNVILYTWSESAKDLPSNVGSLFHGRKSLWERGSLGMKTWCFTPKVQAICKTLDQNLQSLLSDINYYTSSGDMSEADVSIPLSTKASVKTAIQDSDLKDVSDVYKHLGNDTNQCLSEFCSFISGFYSENIDCKDRRCKLIFLSRICEALLHLCPHLYRCVSLNAAGENGSIQLLKSLHLGLDGFKMKSNPHWESAKKDVQACIKTGYQFWLQDIYKSAIEKFENAMIQSTDVDVLKMLLQWDERSIQEEADEGHLITSTIRVPFQISLPLYTLLYELCLEINKAVGHSLQPNLINDVSIEIFENIVKCYAKVATVLKSMHLNKLAQTRALQCLFDVHYLNGMFTTKDESGRSVQNELDDVIKELEMCIDPFDLDVFTPHVQSNLASARHGTSLLFGLAMPGEWSARYRAPYTSSNQDTHNLLLHTSVGTRFQLLPVTSSVTLAGSGRKSSVPELERPGSESSPSHEVRKTVRSQSSSNLAGTVQSSGVNKSSSFYDRMTAMSSSWFGSS